MAGRPLGTETITVVRAGNRTDPYSKLTTANDWTTPTLIPVKGCDVQPGADTEYLIGRDFSEIAYTVFAPVGTDCTAYDRVIYNGVTYEVDGEPLRWSGRLGYVWIHLKTWKG